MIVQTDPYPDNHTRQTTISWTVRNFKVVTLLFANLTVISWTPSDNLVHTCSVETGAIKCEHSVGQSSLVLSDGRP